LRAGRLSAEASPALRALNGPLIDPVFGYQLLRSEAALVDIEVNTSGIIFGYKRRSLDSKCTRVTNSF
jgi:hypothetical protein